MSLSSYLITNIAWTIGVLIVAVVYYQQGVKNTESGFQRRMRLAGEGSGLGFYILPSSAKPIATIHLQIEGTLYRYHRETAQCGWHSPGLGEIHAYDHSKMIYCEKDLPDAADNEKDHVVDEDLARQLCEHLNRTGFLVPEELPDPLEERRQS